jgi:hypothetical protein
MRTADRLDRGRALVPAIRDDGPPLAQGWTFTPEQKVEIVGLLDDRDG